MEIKVINPRVPSKSDANFAFQLGPEGAKFGIGIASASSQQPAGKLFHF